MRSCFAMAPLLLLACQREGAATPRTAGPEPAPLPAHTLSVFATQSLQRPLQALARAYEAAHPGAKVDLRCEAGQDLTKALIAGEQADVVCIGDNSLMSRLAAAALLGAGTGELARTRVALAVAKGNPKQVRSLADVLRADVRLGLGVRASSIGRHGRWVLSRHAHDKAPTVEAAHADALLAEVRNGNCDVAIVYATTFLAAGEGVDRVDLPPADNTPVLYSIAPLRQAREPRGAAAFQAFATSPAGQQVLQQHGLLPIGAKTD